MAKNLLLPTPTSRRVVGLLGGAAALAGSAAALTLAASPASGVTNLIVDSNGDAAATPSNCTNGTLGDCTLRDALAAAQDGDTITFNLATNDTITMAPVNGQFVIDHAITINGPGRDNLTIDGLNATRVFYIPSTVSGAVTLSGLTITNGNSGADSGGGLHSNVAGGTALDLSLSNMTFSGNQNIDTGASFAIYTRNLSISNVVVSGNQGTRIAGGRAFAGASMTVDGFNVSNNIATAHNGGSYLAAANGAPVSVTNSSFISNTAPPVWINSGLTLDTSGPTTVTNSTFADNEGVGVNLKVYASTAVVANCTISGNSSTSVSGGIAIRSEYTDVTIAQSTITDNTLTNNNGGYGSGVGFYLYSGPNASLTITGSIVAANSQGNQFDIGGFNSGGWQDVRIDHSLIGTISGAMPSNDLGGNTFSVTDPGLNALANNGGATLTMSLKATSPAIDGGPNPVPVFPGNQFDQRGIGFARVAYGRADIGAFEIQEPTPVDPDVPVVPNFTG